MTTKPLIVDHDLARIENAALMAVGDLSSTTRRIAQRVNAVLCGTEASIVSQFDTAVSRDDVEAFLAKINGPASPTVVTAAGWMERFCSTATTAMWTVVIVRISTLPMKSRSRRG